MLKYNMCRHRFIVLIRIFKCFVGKILYIEQETSNAEDCFAVAIVKAKTIVGQISYNFLLRF